MTSNSLDWSPWWRTSRRRSRTVESPGPPSSWVHPAGDPRGDRDPCRPPARGHHARSRRVRLEETHGGADAGDRGCDRRPGRAGRPHHGRNRLGCRRGGGHRRGWDLASGHGKRRLDQATGKRFQPVSPRRPDHGRDLARCRWPRDPGGRRGSLGAGPRDVRGAIPLPRRSRLAGLLGEQHRWPAGSDRIATLVSIHGRRVVGRIGSRFPRTSPRPTIRTGRSTRRDSTSSRVSRSWIDRRRWRSAWRRRRQPIEFESSPCSIPSRFGTIPSRSNARRCRRTSREDTPRP